MSLFSSRVFTVAGAIGFIVGFGLFGATTYLPLFLQIVTGASPTASGLELLPLILGLLVTSIGSGQLIARWGHYRPFPIAGTALMVVGFWRLSTMEPSTSALERSLDMVILGLGIGLVVQVLVFAVQNDVDYRDLGVATSGRDVLPLDRRLLRGGHLRRDLLQPPGRRAGGPREPAACVAAGNVTRDRSPSCRPRRGRAYIGAYSDALSTIFVVCAPVAAVASGSPGCCPRSRCGARSRRPASGRPSPRPSARTRRREIERALSTLARRDRRERILERLCAPPGLELTARQCWVLGAGRRARARRTPSRSPTSTRSTRRGWRRAWPSCATSAMSDGPSEAIALGEAGRDALERLVAARRERLAELLDGW